MVDYILFAIEEVEANEDISFYPFNTESRINGEIDFSSKENPPAPFSYNHGFINGLKRSLELLNEENFKTND